MSDSQSTPPDELAGTEQPFVQHLIELRDRLVKAIIAIAIAAVGLALYPGPGPLYDILAAPLVAHLPAGATLIATSVISPFMVPLKILLMTAFLIALPVVGIDLTVLSVFGGAVGVGLGFGLQKIASNYVSGFLILLERSLSIGDPITVDKYSGRVARINTRTTLGITG